MPFIFLRYIFNKLTFTKYLTLFPRIYRLDRLEFFTPRRPLSAGKSPSTSARRHRDHTKFKRLRENECFALACWCFVKAIRESQESLPTHFNGRGGEVTAAVMSFPTTTNFPAISFRLVVIFF